MTGRIHAETQQTADSPVVPLEFSGTLSFADGANASFYCSFTTTNAQWAIVSGDKGLLQVSDFVLPFSGPQTKYSLTRSEFALDRCQAHMHEGRQIEALDEPSNNAPGSQEAGLFHTFSQLVIDGKIDAHWPKISLLTQRVLDACLVSAREGSQVISLND